MKLQYTAALLIALGTTQAATTVTFAKDDKCTEFQGDKVSHSDKGCHKGRAESKSLSFSGIVASQKLCLVKFDNDDCDGSGVRQDVSVSLEDTANCRTIEKPEGQKSYKLEQNPCDGVSQPPEVGESMLTRFMRYQEDSCEELHEKTIDVEDYDCLRDFPGSKSIDFSPVSENTTVCLIKFTDGDCNEQPYTQNLYFVPEEHPCQPVSGYISEGWNSFKIAPHDCEHPTLGELLDDVYNPFD